jgi:hypothetical protein
MTRPTPTPRRRGFTLLELLTACAALIVVLGLSVSLARYVRRSASLAAMREQLITLNTLLAEKGVPPNLPMFAAGLSFDDEVRLPEAVRVLARQNAETWSQGMGLENKAYFDPWGMPIVLINGAHPSLGMAPRFKPFFLSAGPDCRYFTLADDQYGYDLEPGPAAVIPPATRPTVTGHRE